MPTVIGILGAREIALGRPDDAIKRIQTYLSRPLFTQPRFQALVVLLELLMRAGRTTEARLLTVAEEEDIGNMLLDHGFRLRYLAAAADAWRAATDASGQERFRIYASALATLRSATR